MENSRRPSLRQQFLEFEFVAHGDAVGANVGDGGLNPPRFIHSAGIDRREAVAASLVEPNRVDVVVCGDQPQAATAGADSSCCGTLAEVSLAPLIAAAAERVTKDSCFARVDLSSPLTKVGAPVH